MEEVWKPVIGYEGYYEVSSYGRVRSVARQIVRTNGTTMSVRERILKHRLDDHRRPRVSTWKDGVGKESKVCILVAEAFFGPRRDGLIVCHYDGNPENNYVENLRWDTLSANRLDDVRLGVHNESRKTHCKRNHELSGDNLCPRGLDKGKRVCLECRRIRNANRPGVSK